MTTRSIIGAARWPLRALLCVALAATAVVGPVSPSLAQSDSAAFRDLATGTDYRVRVAAALALGKSTSPGARPALEKALSDPHPAVRAAAAAALGALGNPASVTALKAALAGETTVSVKAQIESTIKRLSSAPASNVKAKFLVSLGKIENRSGVSGASIATALKATTRTKIAQVPGVELLDEGADLAAVSKSRKLPAFTLDGSLTQLAKKEGNNAVSYSARVEYLIRKMPEQALKGTMSGAAQALADNKEIRGQTQLTQLQMDALAGAVESAMKGASPALEAALR